MIKITKQKFFDTLEDMVGKKIELLHSGHHIANIVVTENKRSAYAFNVLIQYVGNMAKVRERNYGDLTESFSCNRGWSSNGWRHGDHFEYRSIRVHDTKEKEEAAPVETNPAVIITKTNTKSKLFRFVAKGTPFWYKDDLYQRVNSDTHNSVRYKDGCVCCIGLDVEVIPTTIEINVTG